MKNNEFNTLQELSRDMHLYSRKLLTATLAALIERVEAHVDEDTRELIGAQVNRRVDIVFFPPPPPKGRRKTRTVWGN